RTDVVTADLNYIRHPYLTPNDEYYSYQWGLPTINLPLAWDITTGAASVIVAVVDTGVILTHPDLAGKLTSGYDFIQSTATSNDGDGIDPDPDDPGTGLAGPTIFHGTHVSGIVGAATNNTTGVAGISWGSMIMPVRALSALGGTTYDIMQGVSFAAGLANDSGTLPPTSADIINLSIGGGGFSQAEQDLYTTVRGAGIIIIAAAGNESTTSPVYPASYNNVVSVSAVDIEKNAAYYSNSGATIDVAAPGGNTHIDTDGDGYADGVLNAAGDDSSGTINPAYVFLQGTSMATPHVSGVAALMKSVYPAMTPADFDTFLLNGDITEDLGSAGRDDIFGHGLIDAYKAVAAAKDANDGSPPVPTPTLAVTPSSINMGSNLTSATITANNAGGGALVVNAPTDDASWLTVAAASIDVGGLGSYTVTVDKALLSDGIYTAIITFTSDANTVNVPLIMQVSSTPVTGNAGYHYILLLDPDTFSTIETISLDVSGGSYDYTLTGIDAGDYLIYAGSDLDSDDVICASGEACGAYITLNQPEVVTVNSDMTGLDFDTGFIVNLGVTSSNSSLPPAGVGLKINNLKHIER
ncbi:MAG: S8 family serine peptidase, partial [Thermodesulfobacteriota bacterium]